MWYFILIGFYSFAAGVFFSNLMFGRTVEKLMNLTGVPPSVWSILWAFAASVTWPVGVPLAAIHNTRKFRKFRELEVQKLLVSELEKKRHEKSGG